MASTRQSAPKFTAGRRRDWRPLRRMLWSPAASRSTARAFLIYYTSTLAVMAGVWFGHDFLPRHEYQGFTGFAVTQPPQTLLGCFANWDGVWYRDIADRGYTYDSHEGSYVVFFPGYPCLAGLVSRLASLDTTVSLLLVSHASFFCCICLLEKYLKARFPDLGSGPVLLTLLAFAFSPMSFFFRMAYAESLFCLLLLLMLYGVNRGWPICGLAAIAGAATAVRLVGLALLPVLALHLWDSRSSMNWRYWIRWLVLPFGVWGVLLYMSYLAIDFGDPFVFHSNHVFFNNPPRATESLS